MVDKFRRKSRFRGPATFDSTETHKAAQTGVRRDAQIYLTEATTTLLATESGKVVKATKASATQTFTLPAATAKGCVFTFKCGHASGEVLIDPAGTDTIVCNANSGASPASAIAPAGGTGIKNTAATNIIGDYVTLVADGVSAWDAVAQQGIWASQ